MEKIKLLPCPFCGVVPTQPACFMTGENSDGCVYCTNCYANAAPIEVDEPIEDDEAEAPWHIDAAATWNRRSNFDEWAQNPYTKVLQQSLDNDYVPIVDYHKLERELAAANTRADEARAVALAAATKACVDLVLLDIGAPPTGMDCARAISALTGAKNDRNNL